MSESLSNIELAPEVETVNTQASAQEVDRLLQQDYEFFAEFFLAEELTRAIPEFHHQTWELMTSPEHPRVIEAIPREHAKTTQAKLAVVYHFMFTSRRFCVYLSNTNTIALNACKDIFAFFQTQNYINTYGEIEVETASEGKSIWIFKIQLRSGKWKRCILRAMGANQQMRGINIDNQRPDLAVVDDVEDLENTDSELLQKKLDRWMLATFIKALTREHKIIWIGNMLRKTSLLARLAGPDFADRWTSLVLGSIIRDPETGEMEPLWPELWTLDKLRADFNEFALLGQTESWFCEMMNMPGIGDAGFQPDDMYYEPTLNPDQYLATFLTIDPAFGLDSGRHDATAIVAHGIPADGCPQVLSYVTGHFTEQQIFQHTLQLAYYWKAWTWGIERIAAQKLLATLFEVWLLKKREYRMKLWPLQVNTHDSKASRVRAFVNMMKAKQYSLPSGDLDATTQFLQYDLTLRDQKDDLVDSIAYGPQMLVEYRGAILRNAQMATEGSPQRETSGVKYGTEVANV